MEEKIKENHDRVMENGHMIRFSVIIPVYNVAAYLENCVDSLLHQQKMEGYLEILLVDDGSTDESGQICDRLAEEHPAVKVVHKENGGLSSARNTGIQHAVGEYVLFVDSDDYVEGNLCQELEKALNQYGETDAICFGGIEDDGVHPSPMRRVPVEDTVCTVDGREFLKKQYRDQNLNVEACLYCYRRQFLLDQNLTFKEGILHEDVEFTPRALMRCGQVLEIPGDYYHYMVRDNSISTQKDKTKNIKDLFGTLAEQVRMAERQPDPELERWMKNGVLDSYLNMVQTARMYQKKYRPLLKKRFLLGKAATRRNKLRAALCFVSVRLYCLVNDCYKRLG